MRYKIGYLGGGFILLGLGCWGVSRLLDWLFSTNPYIATLTLVGMAIPVAGWFLLGVIYHDRRTK